MNGQTWQLRDWLSRTFPLSYYQGSVILFDRKGFAQTGKARGGTISVKSKADRVADNRPVEGVMIPVSIVRIVIGGLMVIIPWVIITTAFLVRADMKASRGLELEQRVMSIQDSVIESRNFLPRIEVELKEMESRLRDIEIKQ
jgi:hypothetical protein